MFIFIFTCFRIQCLQLQNAKLFTCVPIVKLLAMRRDNLEIVPISISGHLSRAFCEVLSNISEQMLDAIMITVESLVRAAHHKHISL